MIVTKPHVRSVGDGEHVVLLHSSGSTGRQWATLADELSQCFRTHAVDLHGHGGTPAWSIARPLTLDDEIALVEPLLRAPGGVHVVGHSYGGALALKIASLFPHHVKSVAVYEPVLFRLVVDACPRDRAAIEVLDAAKSIGHWLDLGDADRAAGRFVDFWAGAGTWSALPANQRELIAARMPAVARHFHALFHDSLDLAAVANLPMPVLCLTGAKTRAVTLRIGELLRHALPEAAHVMLEGMGHMGPISHAPEVARQVSRFLSRLPRHSLLQGPLVAAA